MKKQINPTTKAHLLRGAFHLMLLGVCAAPFALAQQKPKNPRPQLQRQQQATMRRTPRQDFGTDKSVAWQNNTVHDGFDPASSLVPPLALKWSRDLGANGVTSISYPLIAQGLVFVTTATANFECNPAKSSAKTLS